MEGGRKRKRTEEDETTSYSGFLEGLDQHDLDHTPQKKTWQNHIVFSDDEDDAVI